MEDRFDASSLAEGLSGLPKPPLVTSEAKGAHVASALREAPYANLGPLVSHLSDVVRDLIEASTSAEGGSDHSKKQAAAATEKIHAMKFAISSTIGTSRLNSHDEAKLWINTKLLWDASLEICEQSGPSTIHADDLHSLGTEIFQLIEDNCDPAHLNASDYVRALCTAADVWARLGNDERAAWCLGQAVKHAERLEELMASDRLPQGAREGCVVQLFDLYLQAAKNCAASKQQSMANNMLARALQLSKHEIVSASASAHMSLGIAELQVEQAQGMINSINASTALVMLRSAEQHLDSAAAAAAEGGVVDDGILNKVHVTREHAAIAASEAHMASGNAQGAVESLQRIHRVHRETSFGFSSLDARMVRAHTAAGDTGDAAQLLTLLSTVQYDDEALSRWMKAYEQVLGAWGSGVAPTQLVSAAISYTRAVHGESQRMQSLLRCILSSGSATGGGRHSQQMALKILAADEVIAAICKDASVQKICLSMLGMLGAQELIQGNATFSVELATAMLQYTPSAHRRRAAAQVAAAHYRAKDAKRCLEYLDLAAHSSGPIDGIEVLMKIAIEIHCGDPLNAIPALRSLDKCFDFHYSMSEDVVRSIVGSLEVPLLVLLEETALQFRTLIPADPTAPTFVTDGVEGQVLRRRLLVLLHAASDASSYYDQLAVTLKVATKRLKIIGLRRFTREDDHVEAIASLGYSACLEALEAGAYVPCVKIASSTCVVLAALKKRDGGIPPRMEGLDVRVLMTGAQAALCSADDGDDGTRSKKFSSATQIKAAGVLLDQAVIKAAEPMLATQRNIHIALHALRLELACRQDCNDAALLALSELGKYSDFLSPDHQTVVLTAMGSMRSPAVCQALCKALLPCMSLNLVPQLLDMCTDSHIRAQVCRRANEIIDAAQDDGNGQLEQYRHWLACTAFNLGAAEASTDPLIACVFFNISRDATVQSSMSACTVLAEKASHALEMLDGAEHEQNIEITAAAVLDKDVPSLQQGGVPLEQREPSPSPSLPAMAFSSSPTAVSPASDARVPEDPKISSVISSPQPEPSKIANDVEIAVETADGSPRVAASVLPESQLPSPFPSHGEVPLSSPMPEPQMKVISKVLDTNPKKSTATSLLEREEPKRISRPQTKGASSAAAAAAVSPAQQPKFPAASQKWLQDVFAAQKKIKKSSLKRKFVPPRPAAGSEEGPSEPVAAAAPSPPDDADVLSIDSV